MDMDRDKTEKLILALEEATLMAKQLPNSTDPSHLLKINSSLTSAHRHLSLFLSQQPNPPLSDQDFEEDEEDPMQMEEDDDNSTSVGKVEEKMRDSLFIQNKRPKRPLSPSSAAAAGPNHRVRGAGDDVSVEEFDPVGTKFRSLDLVYQFHA